MKIVIDIPEELYRDVVKNRFIYDEDGEVITHAIINSTPLPEHHGRLIDANALKMDCGYSNYDGYYHAYSSEAIYNAPTIIEADEGSESE